MAESLKDKTFEVLEHKEDREGRFREKQVERLTALGQAISDPIRVRMLGMMAAGRECCTIPETGVPEEDMPAGICVCEFEGYFGMGQSKVSYHMRKLKDAGLVREEKRGRWSFYSLEREAAEGLLSEAAGWLLAGGGAECRPGPEG